MRTDLPNNFWTMPNYANVTVTAKELRAIQLKHEGWIMAQGHIWDINRQSLGAGIYKLTLKLRN